MREAHEHLIFIGSRAHPPFIFFMPHAIGRHETDFRAFEPQCANRFGPSAVRANDYAYCANVEVEYGQVIAAHKTVIVRLQMRFVICSDNFSLAVHQYSGIVKISRAFFSVSKNDVGACCVRHLAYLSDVRALLDVLSDFGKALCGPIFFLLLHIHPGNILEL